MCERLLDLLQYYIKRTLITLLQLSVWNDLSA